MPRDADLWVRGFDYFLVMNYSRLSQASLALIFWGSIVWKEGKKASISHGRGLAGYLATRFGREREMLESSPFYYLSDHSMEVLFLVAPHSSVSVDAPQDNVGNFQAGDRSLNGCHRRLTDFLSLPIAP